MANEFGHDLNHGNVYRNTPILAHMHAWDLGQEAMLLYEFSFFISMKEPFVFIARKRVYFCEGTMSFLFSILDRTFHFHSTETVLFL
jgi:hypothetical protein